MKGLLLALGAKKGMEPDDEDEEAPESSRKHEGDEADAAFDAFWDAVQSGSKDEAKDALRAYFEACQPEELERHADGPAFEARHRHSDAGEPAK